MQRIETLRNSAVADDVPSWFIDNGCGAGWTGPLVPDWPFSLACRRHDWGYFLGGTSEDRKRVDRQFLSDMLKVSKWYQAPRAFLYYRAVRRLGAGPWTERPEPLTRSEARKIYNQEKNLGRRKESVVDPVY